MMTTLIQTLILIAKALDSIEKAVPSESNRDMHWRKQLLDAETILQDAYDNVVILIREESTPE